MSHGKQIGPTSDRRSGARRRQGALIEAMEARMLLSGTAPVDDGGDLVLGKKNQPPVVDAGLDLNIVMPANATMKGSYTDDGVSGLPLSVQWTAVSGPGVVTFGDVAAADTVASFAAAGTYMLRLTVDDGLSSGFDDVQVTAHQPLVFDDSRVFISPEPAKEGDQVHIQGNFLSDPTEALHTVTIDYGDGSPAEQVEVLGADRVYHFHHTYADDSQLRPGGAFTATVTVQDSDEIRSGSRAFVVQRVPPALSLNAAGTALAGTPYGITFQAADPGDDTVSEWTVDWGDGTVETVAGNGTEDGAATHTYAQFMTVAVKLWAKDEDGSYGPVSKMVQVEGPPLARPGGPYVIAEGSVVTLSGALSTGTIDTYEWDVDYDGVNFDVDFVGRNVGYRAPDGPAQPTVALRVAGPKGSTIGTTTLTIQNIAPTLTMNGPEGINEGTEYFIYLLPATDPGQDTISSWRIDWGDGDVEVIEGSPEIATHYYREGRAEYTIRGWASDEDGEHPATLLYPSRPAGTLDPGFGTGGMASATTPGSVSDTARKVLVLPDGKYMLVGSTGSSSAGDLLLARFNANGTLDTTFDGVGFVVTDFGSAGAAYASSAAVMQDGGVLVAAEYANDAAIARYRPDGSLDPAFGDGGKRVFDFTGEQSQLQDLAVLPDGSSYSAGSLGGKMALFRFTADGALDSSFDGDGVATTELASSARALALLPDGKLLLAGSVYVQNPGYSGRYYGAIVRMLPDGQVDTSFGPSDNGRALVGTGSSATSVAMAVQADGKIILSTEGSTQVGGVYMQAGYITRLTDDGAYDSTFGSGGSRLLYNGSYSEFANALLVDAGGRVYAAGTSYVPFQPGVGRADMTLFRLTAAGAFDATFGDNGRVRVDCSTTTDAHDYAYSLALVGAERIIFAGSTTPNGGSTSDLAVAMAFAGSSGVVIVTDVPPVLELGAPASAIINTEVAIAFNAIDVPADPVNEWIIDWGDQTVQTLAGDARHATHSYGGSFNYTIRISAVMDEGTFCTTRSIRIDAAAPFIDAAGTLHVTGRDATDNVAITVDGDTLNVQLDSTMYSFPAADVARVELRNSGSADTNTLGAGVPGGEVYLTGGALTINGTMRGDVPLSIHAASAGRITLPPNIGPAITLDGTVSELVLNGTAGPDAFLITDTQGTGTGNTIHWPRVPRLRIAAGGGDDVIELDAPLSPINGAGSLVAGGDGNDTIRIQAFPANANSAVSAVGDAGDDQIEVFGTFAGYVTLSPSPGADRVILKGTEERDDVQVQESAIAFYAPGQQVRRVNVGMRSWPEVIIRGNGGDDSFRFTYRPPPAIRFEGGEGEDSFSTASDWYSSTFTVNADRLTILDSKGSTYQSTFDSVETLRVDNGQQPTTLIIAGTPAMDVPYISAYGNDALTVNGGTYSVPAGTPLDPDVLNVSINNAARMVLRSPQRFSQLSIAASAKLDITDRDLVLAATDANRQQLLEAMRARVASGQVFSSSADAIHGAQVTLNAGGDVLTRLVLHGDVDGSGQLDGDDYFRIDLAFLQGLGTLPEADINHDGRVDGADYLLVDRAFLTVHAPPAAPAADASLPLRIASVRELLDAR